ncbi:hypothetical protein K523DRAFT_320792, partial [Schizophyllum commune Tattone D]
ADAAPDGLSEVPFGWEGAAGCDDPAGAFKDPASVDAPGADVCEDLATCEDPAAVEAPCAGTCDDVPPSGAIGGYPGYPPIPGNGGGQ